MYFQKLIILCVILCVSISLSFPHHLQEKGSQDHVHGHGRKSDSETITSTILEEHQDYNVVRYPASKWVCTKMMIDVNNDPMKDWRTEFDNDPIAALSALAKGSALDDLVSSLRKKLDTGKGKMYKKLKLYITGDNSQYAEIKMTKPVTTTRQMVKGGSSAEGLEYQTKCIWTGTPWDNKKLPTPFDKSVFIQNRPKLDVFVRRFGGWALSEKKWAEEKQELMKSLGSRMEEVDMEYYATVEYQSPWTKENRRNEVWFVKQQDEVDLE